VRFEVKARDGLARTGTLEIDGKSFRTPALVYPMDGVPSVPDGVISVSIAGGRERGDLVIGSSGFFDAAAETEPGPRIDVGFRDSPYAAAQKDGPILPLGGIARSLLDSREFITSLSRAKEAEGATSPVYCSVMGLPHRIAFLSYCGLDLFDAVPLIMAAENRVYLTESGAEPFDGIEELPCPCPACASGRRGKEELLAHNLQAAEGELRRVRHAISAGRLRELVEARVRTDPWLVQNLRLMDLEMGDLQEMYAPLVGPQFLAGSKESLSRPDVIRWRRRLVDRYSRPRGARALVLLPCSAKKPYSRSRSHRRFREAIALSGRAATVHEVIVTSPLGLVPRELEYTYPAKHYDIPVTGHWDMDEVKMVQEMVRWLVSANEYDLVISHLGDEREAVNEVLDDYEDTSQGDPGSRESLQRLEELLSERVEETGTTRQARLVDDMRSVSAFQFGEGGSGLADGCGTGGRWPNVRLVRSGTQIGMFTGERGMISLTLAGGRGLLPSRDYVVEIEDFVPKGNLFAVGVESAGPGIRVGDDVVVAHGDDVRAVGVARMCSAEMARAHRGEAVHIRHVAE
jgi:archaeosine synthase